ncbi:MAG TPA: GatB/YqeY domain-containing protein [Edaphobacter sp.]|nr:GatB/YqeY domain-containing protein [Edaphobacter sp.]
MNEMTIAKKVDADIVTAMKAKDEHRLTTLRMVKSALKNKAIDKRAELTDAEESQILSTLIKQRRESVESFTKGNRPELAEKERAEIGMIEGYLPKEAGEDEIRSVVQAAIAHLAEAGTKPGPKDMGAAMKIVQQRILANGLRADGKLVSEIVKTELAKQ